MKRCSFKVAKALKKAGYPQDITDSHYTNWGELVYYGIAGETGFDAPYVMEVWLWLWREKRIKFHLYYNECHCCWSCVFNGYLKRGNDPEEAIEAAIDYLVNENLLK